MEGKKSEVERLVDQVLQDHLILEPDLLSSGGDEVTIDSLTLLSVVMAVEDEVGILLPGEALAELSSLETVQAVRDKLLFLLST